VAAQRGEARFTRVVTPGASTDGLKCRRLRVYTSRSRAATAVRCSALNRFPFLVPQLKAANVEHKRVAVHEIGLDLELTLGDRVLAGTTGCSVARPTAFSARDTSPGIE
jgi:hypothetical protein